MATGSIRPGRNINLRSGRFSNRIRHESAEDVVIKLDHSKDPKDNVKEILKNLVAQHGVASSRKTAYLNSFVKLIKHVGYDTSLGFSILDIVTCLQIALLNEAKQVRTASLRVLRYLLPYDDTLDAFLNLRVDYLVARCLDISLDNEIERIHAIKLMRQIIKTSASKFPNSLMFALVAIGNDGSSERDRLLRVSLETICELTLFNPPLVSRCGGIQTLIWNILDCHQYLRLNESLTSTIIYLLNHPMTRLYIRPHVDLERLLAPFTDSHFLYSPEDGNKSSEDRDSRFLASKMAVITVMRSWPGIIRLCNPEGTGLQSLIGILYLPYVEIRKSILEVISDLFRLTLPSWSDDFPTAFSSVDPSEMKDTWKLSEGFVVEEGLEILPHISVTRPNLIENHLALLLSAWFTAGLCEALIEVVITSEGPLFNRAVILLGELLHMANCLLPPECMHHHECLPSLISIASSPEVDKDKSDRAHLAVSRLTRFHKMMKRGVKPCTVFLDQLLQHAGKMVEATSKYWHLRRDKLAEYYFKKVCTEDMTNHAIRDSQVNSTKTNSEWDWTIISAILKWPDEKLKKLEDQNQLRFIKRLAYYFKPENDLFSRTDFDPSNRKICLAGCHLVEFLLSSTSEEAEKLIIEFLSDIVENLKELTKFNMPVDENAMFGSKRIFDKLCRYYFLFIGQFSTSKKGCGYLEKTGIIQTLLELMSPSCNIMYVKLTISCLNYSVDGSSRAILSKALTATQEPCRLYATKLLRVLMRAGTAGFSHWGVEFLVTQLYDPDKSVSSTALKILDEACDNEENLKCLIKLRPSLLHLGEQGDMLLCRFVSNIQGFRSLNNADFMQSLLLKWNKILNKRYVDIVEEMLNEAFMTFEKTDSGSCPRRSILKGPKKDVFVPPHLYGQLTMHDEGLDMLREQESIQEFFVCIHNQNLLTATDVCKLKTALWAVGHIGLSVDGLDWLESEKVIPEIIRLAEESSIFSVRGTSFFVLGLIACTRKGTDVLCSLGWESRCHTRKDVFPVLDQDGWMHAPMEEALLLSDRLAAANVYGEGNRLSPGVMGLSLIQEENFMRFPSSASRASSISTFRTSLSSIHSAREPLMKHSSTLSQNCSRPPSLIVPSVTCSYVTDNDNTVYRNYPLHSRTQSEKGVSKKTGEFRPRAQTGDRSTLPSPPPVSITKADSVPVHINSVKLRMDESASMTASDLDKRASRDSIQLIASPVVKMRTSSDEDSAIMSDNYDSQPDNSNNLDAVKGSRAEGNLVESSLHSREGSSEVGQRKISVNSYFSSENTVKDKSVTGDVVSFKVGGGSYTAGSHPSSSSESSNISKSRAGSFYADSSGVGSCDSNTITLTSPAAALSPIPSSASLNTLTTVSSSSNLLTGAEQTKESKYHHSIFHRSVFQLARVPSAKRRTASPALGITANGGQSFTSPRDAIGYATLKNIQRQRTYSADAEGESQLEAPLLHRTTSQDSELSVDSNVWLSIRRNVSNISLHEQDLTASPIASLNRAAFKPLSPSNRFMGIALPVDTKMIFEVREGEDKRTSTVVPPTLLLDSEYLFSAVKTTVPPLRKETSFEHNPEVCLQCNKHRRNAQQKQERRDSLTQTLTKAAASEGTQPGTGKCSDLVRARGSSMHDQNSSATPSSLTSNYSSHDTGNRKLTEENEEGRELIKLEVMRLIVNLSSSVGVKGSETALLSLKQRFPAFFQDLCFYSEVIHLMSTYSYRLTMRRFIQELFDELNITQLLESPCQWLGVVLDAAPHMTPIRQDSLDEFQDLAFS